MSCIAGLIELRRYRSEEASATLAVFRAAVRRTALADYSPLQVETWAPDLIDATAWAESRAAISTWVADVEGEVAGFVDLSPEGLIDMLYVHPDHGGRGLGSDLLEVVEQQGRDLGLPELTAHVSATALGVFLRRGFRVVRPQSVELRGVAFRNFVMAKRLHDI